MFSAVFALLFTVGLTYGSPIANQYIDSVLNVALRNEIRSASLDPAVLNNFQTEFQDKVAIIGKVKGKAEYSKGTLSGLSQARRFSECQGPYYSFGAKSINCTITFNTLHINYEGKLKYGKVPKVNIKGKGDVTNTVIFIEVTSQGGYPTLKNFLFQQIGFMKVTFTGLGPLNKFTKFLEDGYKSHVEAQVFNSVSQRFQYAMSRAVASVPMPN
uniref:Mite allergen Lep d 7 n=1 Tax=Parasteatoda tepidariorum TaxID=114398 RepID=A0A2L2Y4S3_PARTP